MPNAWWYLATVRNLLREHGADGVLKALWYLDEAVVEVARSEVDAERPAASPATSGLLSIDGARWLVVRQRETEPPEVYPFADEADARAFHDRAQEQWSDCYLCAVVLHGVRQVQAPPAASGEAQAIADAVHSVTHYCHAGGGEQALEYDPVAKQWICPVCSDEVMVTPAPPDAALVERLREFVARRSYDDGSGPEIPDGMPVSLDLDPLAGPDTLTMGDMRQLAAALAGRPLDGREAIHEWFELSYAQYLTIPRSVLQSMPDEWQGRFVRCLRELDDAIDWRPEEGRYWVCLKDERGRYIRDPLMDYERGRRRIPLRDECPECGESLKGSCPTCASCQLVAALKRGDPTPLPAREGGSRGE